MAKNLRFERSWWPRGLALWLVLAGAGEVGAAGAPGAAALDGLAFRRGELTILIPHLEAQGTALTAQDLRDILDPSSPLAPRQRLARLSASSIQAPEITFRRDPEAGEAEGQSVTLHDVRLTGVEAGKAAALSIASLDGSLRSGPAERDAVSAGAVTAHAVDPVLALDIVAGSRADADLPVSTVCGDFTVSDLRLRTGEADVLAVQALEVGGLDGRPLRDTPSHILHVFDTSPAPMPLPERTRFHELMVDAAASFALDRLTLSGISFTSGSGPAPALRVGRLAVAEVRPASLGRFEIGDASLDAEGVHMALRSASASYSESAAALDALLARGLDLPPAGAVPGTPSGPMNSEARLEDFRLDIPSPADGPLPPGTMNHVVVPLVESGSSASADGNTVEVHAQAKLRYDMPPGGSDPTLAAIRDLGLDHLDASFGYSASYDVEAGTLRLDDLALGDRGAGSVALSGRVDGLPTSGFRGADSRERQLALLADATFRDLSLTVVDHGLLGRAMDVLARQSGTSPALLRAGLKAEIDLHLPELLGPTQAEAAVAAALDRFLDGGGTLEVTARSSGGLAFRDMGAAPGPTSLARRLDITAAAHP